MTPTTMKHTISIPIDENKRRKLNEAHSGADVRGSLMSFSTPPTSPNSDRCNNNARHCRSTSCVLVPPPPPPPPPSSRRICGTSDQGIVFGDGSSSASRRAYHDRHPKSRSSSTMNTVQLEATAKLFLRLKTDDPYANSVSCERLLEVRDYCERRLRESGQEERNSSRPYQDCRRQNRDPYWWQAAIDTKNAAETAAPAPAIVDSTALAPFEYYIVKEKVEEIFLKREKHDRHPPHRYCDVSINGSNHSSRCYRSFDGLA